jgi:hypothetical protein
MAYPDDLPQFAQEMASLRSDEGHQPSLRRAISTAYYALLHLLISDATANCTDPRFRATLARAFDHGPMKQASDRKLSELNDFFDQRPAEGPERTIKNHLYNVAETFSQGSTIAMRPTITSLESGSPRRFRSSSRVLPTLSGVGPSSVMKLWRGIT